MPHPSTMGRRLRSPQGCDERHRFLRPGALARLRDSKIVARSLRSAASAASYARPLLPPCSPPRPTTQSPAAEAGGVPHFFGGSVARGPRYPLRKKLAAARGVVFLPPPPMSPDAAADTFFGAFAAAPSEMVAAH